jgi:pyruvate,water dikinase
VISRLHGEAARGFAVRTGWLVGLVAGLLEPGCNQKAPSEELADGGTAAPQVCRTSADTPASSPREGWCEAAEERLGRRVCVHEVSDAKTWSEITHAATAVDRERTTDYLVPAREDARVPPVFIDANAFEASEPFLHYAFLTESVPDLELLQFEEYLELIGASPAAAGFDPGPREWFAGEVTEFIVPGGDNLFGFTISDQGTNPAATITCEQFLQVYDVVAGRFAVDGPVAAVPANDLQREVLASCSVCTHDPSLALDYEYYTQARRCGTARLYTLEELAAAEAAAEFGWQDILITDQAPLDIQTIIAGIVTGTRQGELSHLNVRSAARGTPNCYLKNAYELLARWEGQLISLECELDRAVVVPVTPEEYERCNEGFKPEPVEVIPADLTWTDLVPLLDLPTGTADERRTAVGRFGSKGANLAVLYQRIDPGLQLTGFLIPMHYYDAFVRDSSWSVDLGSGPENLTFAQTIGRLLDDPVFSTDGAARRERLAALQAAMEGAPCDPALVSAIEAAILETYDGRDDVMVRFRSSSNAEDSLRFTGAGLYDSTSVCLADERDADASGPSRCDPDQPDERDVCRGLRRVWASLWNMKAFEERAWYGIDHRQVAMGILVNTRTKGELANIVAFSGNPLLWRDKRYLVNAQLGELDVVAAVPGVWPEKDLLTVENGLVTKIERARGSTELPEGEVVLDDALLRELGAALSSIVEVYPVDAELLPTVRVLLDTEWKLRSDGRLAVKQVRPFIE